MQANEVVDLYDALARSGVNIWIDGGWAVDAVVGFQTRSHDDLDVAIELKDVAALQRLLATRGYRQTSSGREPQWNFVLEDGNGRKIDVHVVVLDEHGGVWVDALDGIAYPAGSLTGEGVIAGAKVRCVSAELQLRFKTSYPPRAIDRQDVAALCALLKLPVPDTHK